jgi:DNA invertase Pin-like site-specific DNA recombinase
LGAIAAFERDLMLERQSEGIARAAAEGKYKGRAPTRARQGCRRIAPGEGRQNAGSHRRRSRDWRRIRVPHPGVGTGCGLGDG